MQFIFMGEIPDDIMDLYYLFDSKGFELAIVGGWVRDWHLGIESHDMDLTTNARPDQIKEIVNDWADIVWPLGEAFGTIAMRKNGIDIEITTYRADTYDGGSRKPTVVFGDSLEDDLKRRDFTINAIAIKLPDIIVDPFFGYFDLMHKILRTPGDPKISINDDPLRIYRAARFIAKYGLTPEFSLSAAICILKDGLSIVSVERISAELEKLMSLPDPVPGIDYLLSTGVISCDQYSVEMLDWLITFEPPVSIPLRFAALFYDLGTEEIGSFMRKLRFPNKLIRSVKRIHEMHRQVFWARSDKQIRKLIMSSREDLEDILKLADASYPFQGGMSIPKIDRIREIAETEDLSDRFDGKEIMFLLDITAGPVIGEAIEEMRDYIAENGPTSRLIMGNHLINWYTIRI